MNATPTHRSKDWGAVSGAATALFVPNSMPKQRDTASTGTASTSRPPAAGSGGCQNRSPCSGVFMVGAMNCAVFGAQSFPCVCMCIYAYVYICICLGLKLHTHNGFWDLIPE